MYVCQWHLDIPYGRQGEAIRVIQAWGRDKLAFSGFRRAKSTRLAVGHVGVSASHVVDEYVFETLADFEAALAGMSEPRFGGHSDALAPLVVPASQHWEILRIIE